jgi:hypothetical protein
MRDSSSAKAQDATPVVSVEVNLADMDLKQLFDAVDTLQREQATLIGQLREAGQVEPISVVAWPDEFKELGDTRDEFYTRVGSQLDAIIGK